MNSFVYQFRHPVISVDKDENLRQWQELSPYLTKLAPGQAVFVLSFFLSESLNLETVLVFERLTLTVVQKLFKELKGFLFLRFHCVVLQPLGSTLKKKKKIK